MVSLPVSCQTNSSTTLRNCSSLSPVLRSNRISTIMGTMTFIQPERIKESVPSKSNRTTRAFRADTPGVIFSTIPFHSTEPRPKGTGFLTGRSCPLTSSGFTSAPRQGSGVLLRRALCQQEHCACDADTHHCQHDGGIPDERSLAENRQRGKNDCHFQKNFTEVQPKRLLALEMALVLQCPGLFLNLL